MSWIFLLALFCLVLHSSGMYKSLYLDFSKKELFCVLLDQCFCGRNGGPELHILPSCWYYSPSLILVTSFDLKSVPQIFWCFVGLMSSWRIRALYHVMPLFIPNIFHCSQIWFVWNWYSYSSILLLLFSMEYLFPPLNF